MLRLSTQGGLIARFELPLTALKQEAGAPTIGDLLSVERIRCNADASSKKRALELISELIVGNSTQLQCRNVSELLLAREKLGSTALGHGVALPHGRCAGLTEAIAIFLKLRTGVDFDAPDDKPVDLIVGLLVPEQCNEGHLQLLAQLAELFSQESVREELRGPVSALEVQAIFNRLSTAPS